MKVEGYYVDMTGKVLDVIAVHTSNPRIVDLSEHNLGMVVVDQQFFEDEDMAKQQAKYNAEDTIADCEARLAELEKPKKKVPQGDSKRGWTLGRSKKADPLGPPEYGVGKTLVHKKSDLEYRIIGFNAESDDGIEYVLKRTKGAGMVRLSRAQVDLQYEVIE